MKSPAIPLMAAAALVAAGCRSPGSHDPADLLPTTYPRIVIETYRATGASALTRTIVGLYSSAGSLLASDTNTASTDRIDYTAGLVTGTCYVRVAAESASGKYAVRVLSLGVADPVPGPVYFATENSADTGYESDDAATPASPGAILAAASPGTVLNRALAAAFADVDWVTLALP